jgi:hypothetical protein
VSEFIFEFFSTVNDVDIAFDEVVVEDFFFNKTFPVVCGEEFFEFFFGFGGGID